MNHNNQIRAARLNAETNAFGEWLLSKIGQETSSKTSITDFEDRIRSVTAGLPAEQRYHLSRLLEPPLVEALLSYQDSSKLDRLLREWAEIIESDQAHSSEKLRRVTGIVRPLIEEMRTQLIERLHENAEEERLKQERYIEGYLETIKQFGDDHPEFAQQANAALQNNPSTGTLRLPVFASDAEQQTFVVDLKVLLQPFEKAIYAELRAYNKKCNERMMAAWEAMCAIDKLTRPTPANMPSARATEGGLQLE